MQEQEVPLDKIGCPECGADPTDESVVQHHLSDMGYYHDDVQMVCSDCETKWAHGLPIGEFDGHGDLWCDCCDDSWQLVHRVKFVELSEGRRKYRLHLKCPECYYFKRVGRESDGDGLALIGYPHITGEVEGAESYGYHED